MNCSAIEDKYKLTVMFDLLNELQRNILFVYQLKQFRIIGTVCKKLAASGLSVPGSKELILGFD